MRNMEYAVIILSSVTYAKRVEKECEKYGITCTIGHTPAQIAQRGCSFMVKVRMCDLKKVMELIDKLMLKTFGVYRKKGDGTYDLLG